MLRYPNIKFYEAALEVSDGMTPCAIYVFCCWLGYIGIFFTGALTSNTYVFVAGWIATGVIFSFAKDMGVSHQLIYEWRIFRKPTVIMTFEDDDDNVGAMMGLRLHEAHRMDRIPQSTVEFREWCRDNLSQPISIQRLWRKPSWADGRYAPAFAVLVVFENDSDAVLFKLRWC